MTLQLKVTRVRTSANTSIILNLIENLKNILSAARSSGIKVVYVLHHLTEKGGLCRLKKPATVMKMK
jgi:hypothetical protein